MEESVITLKNIYKKYDSHEVLKGVNLEIKKGQIYGLVGKNGAGKSTVFKLILGLSDYSEGTITIDGTDDVEKGRTKIGFFIGSNYFPNMTARQNLRYFATLKGIKNKKEEVDRLLEIVGLKGVKTKVKGYSLGMRQRLGIANAIMGNPEILILDEPTNGLDPQGIADIRKLVKWLNKEYGMTIIVSSHILGELQNTAHRFAILHDGVIVRDLAEDELVSGADTLKIKASDFEKAKKALEDAGVEATIEPAETQSLESLYFSLVGEEGNTPNVESNAAPLENGDNGGEKNE